MIGPDNSSAHILKWRTSSSKVLKVYQNGNVRAVGTGTAWITARTQNGIEKSCRITVKNAPSDVKLRNTVMTLGVGETISMSAVIPEGSAAANRTFSSSDKRQLGRSFYGIKNRKINCYCKAL